MLPLPPGTSASGSITANSLACEDTSRSCVVTDAGATTLVYEGAGRSWVRTPVPIPVGAHYVWTTVVACAPAGPCRIFVDYGYKPGGPDRVMVLTRFGRHWMRSAVPSPVGGWQGTPADPSCPTASSCVVTDGDYVVHQVPHRWIVTKIPAPPSALRPWFSLVACPAESRCVAAGGYTDAGGYSQGLFGAEGRAGWLSTPAPLAAGAGVPPTALLGAITCPARGTCFAFGELTDPVTQLSGRFAVAETYTAGAWKATGIRMPSDLVWFGADISLQMWSPFQIACASTSSCVAIATPIHRDTGAWALLQVTLSRGQWRTSLIKAPGVPNVFPSASGMNIQSLACPAVDSCVAVGSVWDADQQRAYSIVMQQHAGGWAFHEFPDVQKCLICGPGLPGDGFSSVSCWRPSACIAVGDTVAISSGATWKNIASAPDPAHDGGAVLSHISCGHEGSLRGCWIRHRPLSSTTAVPGYVCRWKVDVIRQVRLVEPQWRIQPIPRRPVHSCLLRLPLVRRGRNVRRTEPRGHCLEPERAELAFDGYPHSGRREGCRVSHWDCLRLAGVVPGDGG